MTSFNPEIDDDASVVVQDTDEEAAGVDENRKRVQASPQKETNSINFLKGCMVLVLVGAMVLASYLVFRFARSNEELHFRADVSKMINF